MMCFILAIVHVGMMAALTEYNLKMDVEYDINTLPSGNSL
jgi:hypothetical protein